MSVVHYLILLVSSCRSSGLCFIKLQAGLYKDVFMFYETEAWMAFVWLKKYHGIHRLSCKSCVRSPLIQLNPHPQLPRHAHPFGIHDHHHPLFFIVDLQHGTFLKCTIPGCAFSVSQAVWKVCMKHVCASL